MKKNKIVKIVKYNLEKNLRNKWFIGLNILLLLGTIITLNFNTVKGILKNNNIISGDKELNIEVVDNTNIFYKELEDGILNNDNYENLKIEKMDRVSYDENMPKNKVIIEITESEENIINAKVISKDGINQKYYSLIESAINKTKSNLIISKYKITETQLEKIKEDVEIERIMVGVDNSNSDSKQIAQTIVSYMTLIILMLILSKIAGDVSQEKVTKSIEYVLTSISAKEYLIAKILSISFTMIIQVVFTFVYFIIASSTNSILNMVFSSDVVSANIGGFSLSNLVSFIDSTIIIYILVVFVFLVLTVFFMCIIQATLTSKTTNISEAGNTTTILIMVNLALYFVSTLVITPLKETSIIFYILSCIPIISMYFVPSMIIIGQANVIQIIIATILLVSSIPISLNVCSKIFKNGILDNTIKKKKEKEDGSNDIKEKELTKVKKMELAKYGYVIGMSVIIYVAVQLILTYALSIFINPIYNAFNGSINIDTIEMIVNIIIFAVSLYLPGLFVLSYVENDNKVNNNSKELGIKDNIKAVLIAVPFVFAVQISLGYLLEKLGLNYDIVDKVDLYKNTSVVGNILFFVYISIMPAIFEEYYIRKAVINFSKKYGNVFAIISSAILFAVLHLNISQSLFAFIMGIILGIIAIKQESIIPTGIVHFLNNGYAALSIIFENNHIAMIVINVIYIILCIIGIILLVMYVIKNKEAIKEVFNNIKNSKKEKRVSFKYIALDYTFIIACILMIVMLILTQKTIEML